MEGKDNPILTKAWENDYGFTMRTTVQEEKRQDKFEFASSVPQPGGTDEGKQTELEGFVNPIKNAFVWQPKARLHALDAVGVRHTLQEEKLQDEMPRDATVDEAGFQEEDIADLMAFLAAAAVDG